MFGHVKVETAHKVQDRPLEAAGPVDWLVLLLRYDKSQFGLCDPTDVDRDHSYLVTPGRVRRQFAGDQARLFVDRQHQRRGLLDDEELDVV